MAPPLAGSPRVQGHRDYVIKALLHGLTGPIGDRTYTEVMVPMGAQNDDWIAAIGSYVRNSFGNTASFITPADVARVRAATTQPEDELDGAGDRGVAAGAAAGAADLEVDGEPQHLRRPSRAVTLAGWSSAVPQQAGMWFQIELPEPAVITEVQFDAAATGRAGGAGRGAAAGPWCRPAGAATGAAPDSAAGRGGAGRAVHRGAGTAGRLPARVPDSSVDGRQDLERAGGEGSGQHPDPGVIRARPREGDSHHADGGRRCGCAAMVDSESADLSGAARAGTIAGRLLATSSLPAPRAPA